MPSSARVIRHMSRHALATAPAAIFVLWAVACLPGIDSVGLINWQESVRALAAREMHDRSDWIVPTVAGQPYLAKPPMIYWCQLALAELRGTRVGESELRAVVAVAGLLGAFATYAFAGLFLGRDPPAVALWSAAFLVTGILHVRSSRLGELDILLVPFTVVAIGSSLWLCLRNDRAERWNAASSAALASAALACAGAALTKGPPALLTIALAVIGGVALVTAARARDESTRGIAEQPLAQASSPDAAVQSSRRRDTSTLVVATIAALIAVIATLAVNRHSIHRSETWIAAALFAIMIGPLAAFTPIFTSPRTAAAFLRGVWASGIAPALALGFAALWSWSRAVESRVGSGAMSSTAAQEAADNLRILAPNAPIENLEALAFGVGAGSVAAIICLVWFITKRPRIQPAWWFLIAWLGLGLIAFSIFGRGTGRYLTPLWPAVALLGGVWIAHAIRDLSVGRSTGAWIRRAFATTCVVLAAGQAWWYASGRLADESTRSPREFLRELLAPDLAVDPARLAAVDFWNAALDFYAGAHVEPVADLGPWIDYPHDETPIDAFVARLRDSGVTYTLLVRQSPAPLSPSDLPPESIGVDPIEHLRSRGLTIEPVAIGAEYRIDRRRTRIVAVRASAPR